MTGGRTRVVFGETLCLSARSRSRLRDARASAGGGRSAKAGRYLSGLTSQVELPLERCCTSMRPDTHSLRKPVMQGFGEDHTGPVAI
jgi:hypothetical protein